MNWVSTGTFWGTTFGPGFDFYHFLEDSGVLIGAVWAHFDHILSILGIRIAVLFKGSLF